jgi:hypothetical protein
VDLEAYYDGPVISGDIPVAIDDLVLCEDCLQEAGALIGLYNSEDLKKENTELGEAVENKNREIEELRSIVSELGGTVEKFGLGHKPKMVEIS